MSAPAPPLSPLSRSETIPHRSTSGPDPFAPRRRPGASFVNALLATALFRCWHILVFFAAWSTLITVLNWQGHNLRIEPTLLTVLGTVLGFVISYRTTSSFERYNEGRRLWSQVIYASRNFSRLIWFHVPDNPAGGETEEEIEDAKARTLVEKKTVINLVEAYAVAIKHYLRGEDGIYYQDLYYLIKFLPAYALPAGIPSQVDLHVEPSSPPADGAHSDSGPSHGDLEKGTATSLKISTSNEQTVHYRAAAPAPLALSPTKSGRRVSLSASAMSMKSPRSHTSFASRMGSKSQRGIIPAAEEAYLFPASMPPKYSIFDIFPFSLLIKAFSKSGHEVKGKKAARIRAKMRNSTISRNLPLEISLYLSSYVSDTQNRKHCDVPTMNMLHLNLNLLIDALTGLERILTTPVPFSYSIHLWVVTIIYCLALPFQIWKPLQWVTIPATTIASFIFFGFLVAGEEIENPFGYDKNDLNLDHFTSNIIHYELKAITSAPPPRMENWAFVAENNLLFSSSLSERIGPNEWVNRGSRNIKASLGAHGH